ncbi:MAG: hypothetical protein EZS28_031196 [Streblomastix strix]|uniref:Uncharacterized protein n=1 Tax=Streblomastix strix TaxID=222440 RepID=A0A5J4USA0_9EUKA|nr:MAG: hypothetical protein EZS28_031196 [Streblomastix strix]
MKNKNNWDSFVLIGCNADPTDRDGLPYQLLPYKMLSNKQLLMEYEAKPQFTGTPFNIPLNAVIPNGNHLAEYHR